MKEGFYGQVTSEKRGIYQDFPDQVFPENLMYE